jgi:hypothetical protein
MYVSFSSTKLDDSNTARLGNKSDGLWLSLGLCGSAQLIWSSWRETAAASCLEAHGTHTQCGMAAWESKRRLGDMPCLACMQPCRLRLRSEAVKRQPILLRIYHSCYLSPEYAGDHPAYPLGPPPGEGDCVHHSLEAGGTNVW